MIRGAAENIASRNERSGIVIEAQRRGTTKSDLLLQVRKMDERLSALGIVVERTPRFQPRFQIDETAFEMHLDREVKYSNPKARLRDIESVRSIYVQRRGRTSREIEKTRGVMVTSNTGFAKAAFAYEREVEESAQLPAVVSDTSLANDAWLKAPVGASGLPRARVLALSYGALCPSEDLWSRYMGEIDRLEAQGAISARDLLLLRSDPSASGKLMYVTSGDADVVTEETPLVLLGRVKKEYRQEFQTEFQRDWDVAIGREREARQSAEREREEAREQLSAVIRKAAWWSDRWARRGVRVVEVVVCMSVVGATTGVFTEGTIAAVVASTVATIWAIGSTWRGWSVRGVCLPLQKRLWLRSFRRKLKELGLDREKVDAAVAEWSADSGDGSVGGRGAERE